MSNDEAADLYRSVYQYNDAMPLGGTLDGMSYAAINDAYLKLSLSKDSMTGSTASSDALPSSDPAPANGDNTSRYESADEVIKSVRPELDETKKKRKKSGQEREKGKSGSNSNSGQGRQPYQDSSSAYSGSQADRPTLGRSSSSDANGSNGDGYENEPNSKSSYHSPAASDAYQSSTESTQSTYSDSLYVPAGSDGTAYTTSTERSSSDETEDNYETPALGKQNRKAPVGYETGSITYGSDPEPGTYYETTPMPQGDGTGFRGLGQTQHRLLDQLQTSGGVKGKGLPLYMDAQGTDFYESFSWNERWQALLERPTMTPEEVRQRGEDINQLTEEFLTVAKPIVRRIVEELHLPVEEKTFKPVDVGGVAGGEKFMAKQLFIKYARDNIKLRLYNGDAWAQKAALHELKSLNALIACNIPNLHFPLMACISCYGHYVVVVSKLPLSKDTLVYGSANVAQNIKTDRELGLLFKQAAEKLNLEPHYVIEGTTKLEKLMYGPVDIEGHKGRDGRAYIVDTARLFPPAPPVRGIRGCHLYKLLRKELVRTNPVPLSSDAFSFFGKVNADEHNLKVKDAVNRIFKQLIPGLLARPNINDLLSYGNITDLLHHEGINIRFLGVLLADALQQHSPRVSMHALSSIALEMVARASKAVFFLAMRTQADDSKNKIKECKRLAAEHFNYLLFSQANYQAHVTSSDPSQPTLSRSDVDLWWSADLIPTVKQRFVFFKGDPEWVVPESSKLDEAANRVFTMDLVEQVRKRPSDLLARAASMAGVVFKKTLLEQIEHGGNDFFFFNQRLLTEDDIEEILTLDKRVQYVPFVDIKGAGNFEDAERFYLAEIKNRVAALGHTHPQVALSYRHLGELYADKKGYEEKAKNSYIAAASIIKAYYKTPSPLKTRELVDILNLHADLYIKFDRAMASETILTELLDLFRPDGDDARAGPFSWSFVSKLTNMDQMAEVAPILDKLARVKSKTNQFQEAEQLYVLSCSFKERVFGPDHYQVARTLNGHAQWLFSQNRLSEARDMCAKVKTICEQSRGATHSEVGIALDNLARVYGAENQFDEADSLLQRALEIKIKSLGESHSYVAMTLDHMASNKFKRLLYTTRSQGGSEAQAKLPIVELQAIRQLYEKALATIEASLGVDHSAYGITKSNLAVINCHLNEWATAVEMATEALETIESSLGASHPSMLIAKANLSYLTAHQRSPPDLVPMDALRLVYHAQYIATSTSERSKIPDKIKLLLEKKGLAVTEANAQKITELLKRKKQQQTVTPAQSGYENVAAVPEKDGSRPEPRGLPATQSSSMASMRTQDSQTFYRSSSQRGRDEGYGDAGYAAAYSAPTNTAPTPTSGPAPSLNKLTSSSLTSTSSSSSANAPRYAAPPMESVSPRAANSGPGSAPSKPSPTVTTTTPTAAPSRSGGYENVQEEEEEELQKSNESPKVKKRMAVSKEKKSQDKKKHDVAKNKDQKASAHERAEESSSTRQRRKSSRHVAENAESDNDEGGDGAERSITSDALESHLQSQSADSSNLAMSGLSDASQHEQRSAPPSRNILSRALDNAIDLFSSFGRRSSMSAMSQPATGAPGAPQTRSNEGPAQGAGMAHPSPSPTSERRSSRSSPLSKSAAVGGSTGYGTGASTSDTREMDPFKKPAAPQSKGGAKPSSHADMKDDTDSASSSHGASSSTTPAPEPEQVGVMKAKKKSKAFESAPMEVVSQRTPLLFSASESSLRRTTPAPKSAAPLPQAAALGSSAKGGAQSPTSMSSKSTKQKPAAPIVSSPFRKNALEEENAAPSAPSPEAEKRDMSEEDQLAEFLGPSATTLPSEPLKQKQEQQEQQSPQDQAEFKSFTFSQSPAKPAPSAPTLPAPPQAQSQSEPFMLLQASQPQFILAAPPRPAIAKAPSMSSGAPPPPPAAGGAPPPPPAGASPPPPPPAVSTAAPAPPAKKGGVKGKIVKKKDEGKDKNITLRLAATSYATPVSDEEDFQASQEMASSASSGSDNDNEEDELTLNEDLEQHPEALVVASGDADASQGWATGMDDSTSLANDRAADELFGVDVDDEDLEGLDLDRIEQGTPAPHTGPNWGWGGI